MSSLAFLCLLSFVATIRADDFSLDQESLDAIAAEAWEAAKQKNFVPESFPMPKFRAIDLGSLRDLIREDLRLQLENQGFDESQAKANARVSARVLAPSILAKYDFVKKDIVAVDENFAFQADVIDLPQLNSRNVVRAVLVHEMMHAIDDYQFEFTERLKTLNDSNALEAYNAVIEGHAQYQARRLCELEGWSEAFETYTSIIGKPIPTDDPSGELLAKVAGARNVMAYRDGERFVKAILESAPDEETRKKRQRQLFQEPPDSVEFLYHPDWFIDPSRRPTLSFDFDSALLDVYADYEEDWSQQLISLSRPPTQGCHVSASAAGRRKDHSELGDLPHDDDGLEGRFGVKTSDDGAL